MRISGITRTLLAAASMAVALGVATVGAQAAEYVIRFSHGMPESMSSDQHAYAVIFKEMVEAGSKGAIEVRILGANQVGNERQQLEKVQNGINQMANISEGLHPTFFKSGLVLGIPFLFRSSAVVWEVMDGWFGDKYNAAFLEATGMRFLSHSESGFRSLFNSKNVIQTPEDLVGLKIRTMENPAHMAMMDGLGANPTPIPWPEVYTSLQQKVVDGMENPPGLFFLMKFYEQQKYLTIDRHLYSFHSTVINEDFFRSLPESFQDLIVEADRVALTVGRAVAVLGERTAIEKLREAGIEVYSPTPEEYAMFREKGRPPAEAYVRGEIGDAWVDDMLKAVAEAEAKLTASP
jgi:tripartite ATP-independent transporter DctP family solute receptor